MPHYRGNFGAVIQARMSSARLPGKVLRELAGRAILDHVYHAAREILPPEAVVVATSNDDSDDPVADFCRRKGIRVSRGPLENVGGRLQQALSELDVEAFFRICADSPFYDPRLMRTAIERYQTENADLVTNVFPRSFPKGQSVELARVSAFRAVDFDAATPDDREHVFQLYYREPSRFRILNFSAPVDQSALNLCIDTEEDWQRAVRLAGSGGQALYLIQHDEMARTNPGGAQ